MPRFFLAIHRCVCKSRSFVLTAMFAVGIGLLSTTVGGLTAAPTFTSLFSFNGGAQGSGPNGRIIFDSTGALYGTTYSGGATNGGTVFKLTPQNDGTYTETVLYSFSGGADGGLPAAGLVMDIKGRLYGTASSSQATPGRPVGVVFELTPPASMGGTWTYNVIHRFTTLLDGSSPNSDLIFGSGGALFGTTVRGGANGQGTVFRLIPPTMIGAAWTETVIYSFTGLLDGAQPYSALAFDSSGALYGTTVGGGNIGNGGTIFKLTPPTVPIATWTETTLYRFKGFMDGEHPLAGVVVGPGGTIFGTTYMGAGGKGAIYAFDPTTATESVIHSFDGTDGANPSDTLTPDGSGTFYGTTGGAATGNAGNVFQLTPSSSGWKENVLYTFTGGTDGQAPLASVTLDSSGAIYGTTFYGGALGAGSVFRITK